MPIKTCRECGKEFNGRSIRSSYCDGPCYRAKERAYSHRHSQTFSPERRRAANLVYTAKMQGKLIPQPCEVCGRGYTVAHHDDYAAPLDVRWLCRSHHRKHHHQFGPGRNA
jgi:ribosomal protein S27AE